MRTSLLPSAVRSACYNVNRKNYNGRLFELAKIYNPEELPLKQLPNEKMVLATTVFGENEDFFTLKGVVESIINNFCNGIKVEFVRSKKSCLHPTRGADIIINGVEVGYLGQIHPEIIEKLDVDKPIYASEIYYDELTQFFNDKIIFKPISKFPIIERDLAILVDKEVTCSTIIDAIKQRGGKYLESVTLFDIYEGAQVEKGKKSMAFNLIFVAQDRTLNIEEIDGAINKILRHLTEVTGAQLR